MMIILVTIGAMLAVAIGIAVAMDLRDRRSRRRRVQSGQIDAIGGQSLIVGPVGGHSVSEYLPPPDDGRPQH
jgi:hypothetical protein